MKNVMDNKDYFFNGNSFVIQDYDNKKPFASFLPGIAGIRGIPMWCHYINRAQVISSFGLRDKNGSILEFFPANQAYRMIDKIGYRTFIKKDNKVFEPFKPTTNQAVKRKMYINSSSVKIEEINNETKIKTEVQYFGLPNENLAGLVRVVNITNLGETTSLEILDGISQLLPSGIDEWRLKHQSNLLKSWFDVITLDSNVAYYVVNSVPADEAEVNEIESGNYYFSLVEGKAVKPIYDANIIFGFDTTLSHPIRFASTPINELIQEKNIPADKVAVGFTPYQKKLECNESLKIITVIGFSSTKEIIENKVINWLEPNYFDEALDKAQHVLDNITDDIETHTAISIFDNYMKQNYLDNVLRGGHPFFIDTKSNHFVYHLFSRRHGDIEREYNFFTIEPEFYSQGNGNFRDVCQNRRSDNLFHPNVGIYNAKVFASLIGLDGYNPLGIGGSTFEIEDKSKIDELQLIFQNDDKKIMKEVLSKEFTPGLIINTMENNHIITNLSDNELFETIFDNAKQNICATFGEGYWSDHWTYIIDLVENALVIYPELKSEYLFNDYTYGFYENPVFVLPRKEKYVLGRDHNPHQYGALIEQDIKKIKKLNLDINKSNWAKDVNGDLLYTNLYGKLLTLVINKFSSMDQDGMGIEMEANKPGWNDAMNGLPGVFGSGVSELIELARVIEFLLTISDDNETKLPKELINLAKKLYQIYLHENDTFTRWDKASNAKEEYREKIHYGVTKEITSISVKEVRKILKLYQRIIDQGLMKALEFGNNIFPTFFIRRSNDYVSLDKKSHLNLPIIKINSFNTFALPYFLEGPARAFKYIKNQDILRKMYQEIKQTELYDKKLNLYKTSVSLDDWGYDIGRVRAFQKGWLERESDFLHMTYKYLYGLLKGGLYEEFYNEIEDNFVCFMDPSRYGRSTLENSSFIATSNNPDPLVWGQGFVSRLSGSTAEALSMWFLMMFGKQPIRYENNELIVDFKPLLSKEFFDENHEVKVKFLSNTMIIYHNENLIDSYKGIEIKKILLDDQIISNGVIKGDIALDLRAGKYKKVDIYF